MDARVEAEAEHTPKRRKFRELAEKRTNRALDAIRRIGNLSNTQLYEWEDAELKKVLKALKDAIGEVEERFAAPKSKKTGEFRL